MYLIETTFIWFDLLKYKLKRSKVLVILSGEISYYLFFNLYSKIY